MPGISAVELNYPQHFAASEGDDILALAAEAGLAVTALNLRFDGPQFTLGAFTHPDPASREAAVGIASEAVDLAAANGIDHVILWMGPDGFDYPFQADYRVLWEMEIDGFRRVAGRNPAVRVSVEYKPSDPRRVSLIRSMSDSLLAVADVGLPNFGVTLDLCHVLMAGEHPAAVAALAIQRGKLFGVHLNDGYGPADDGMMVGSVHPWHILELLLEMRRGGFAGTIYFDTFPDRVDPAAEAAANVAAIRRFERLLDRIPVEELDRIRAAQDAVAATKLIHGLAFGERRCLRDARRGSWSSAASTWTSSPPPRVCRGEGSRSLGGTFAMAPGGKAGNQACQCALAGAATTIVTRLGDDAFGRELRDGALRVRRRYVAHRHGSGGADRRQHGVRRRGRLHVDHRAGRRRPAVDRGHRASAAGDRSGRRDRPPARDPG